MPEPAALGAEFVRWEIATAIAGALLGINPFDEPNVQQAKDATQRAARRSTRPTAGCRSPRRTVTMPGGIALTLSAAARDALGGTPPTRS